MFFTAHITADENNLHEVLGIEFSDLTTVEVEDHFETAAWLDVVADQAEGLELHAGAF